MISVPDNLAGFLRIILIDDLPFRRASLKSLLEDWAKEDNMRLEALDLSDLRESGQGNCDVQLIVFNVGGESMEAPELQGRIEELRGRQPDVPLVILSDRDDADEVVNVLKAGARGFISSQISPSVVFQALRFIMGGGVYFPANALLGSQNRAPTPDWRRPVVSNVMHNGAYCTTLTVRQNAVLRLLQQGHSNKRIARELSMCESTVKVHVRQIMRKLGASNRTQAALCGMERGQAVGGLSPALPEAVKGPESWVPGL
ncbi:MAG: response regulator transcription factor [Pseudomonadota bacterium]